jgi:hypothetical protein
MYTTLSQSLVVSLSSVLIVVPPGVTQIVITQYSITLICIMQEVFGEILPVWCGYLALLVEPAAFVDLAFVLRGLEIGLQGRRNRCKTVSRFPRTVVPF